MTGTVDSSTTRADQPGAAARDQHVDQAAGAASGALTDSWPSPGTSCTASRGQPATAERVRSTATMRRVGAQRR